MAPPTLRAIHMLYVVIIIFVIIAQRFELLLQSEGMVDSWSLLSQETRDMYSLAFNESDGFFDDIREADWSFLKERIVETSEYFQSCQNHSPSTSQTIWEPNFTCLHERRLGHFGDGLSQWVCDPHRIAAAVSRSGYPCLVYSFRSADSYSFEESVLTQISPECDIVILGSDSEVDPPYSLKAPNVIFQPWTPRDIHGVDTALKDIQRQLDHTQRDIDIFAIDYKDYTWDSWFKSWLDSEAIPPRQVLINMYADPLEVSADRSIMMYLIKKGYVIFHKEVGCQGFCTKYGLLRLSMVLQKGDTAKSWRDRFLLIQPTALDFTSLDREQEIKKVHETNSYLFTNIRHPNERNFRKLFDLAQEDKINIIANGDIFFDDRSQLQQVLEIPCGVCYALSRWELDGDGELFDRADSQDVWIFRGKINLLSGFANFSMGTACCDNRLAWELEQSGYSVLNPSKTIKTWHLHQTAHRTYSDLPPVSPPYTWVSPTDLHVNK